MVVYLSGMTAVSQDVIEASKIDGANAAQTLRLIIIPLMKQTFKFAFIMDAISSLRMYTEAAVLTAKDAGGVAREVAEGVITVSYTHLRNIRFVRRWKLYIRCWMWKEGFRRYLVPVMM